jgi:hypothetical protein
MGDGAEIRGGADEFEAAVIAVVLDQIARDEMAARQGKGGSTRTGLSAWVRALLPEQPDSPREVVWPEV